METVQKLEVKVEADGRTAYIIAGTLKVYDHTEARTLMNPGPLEPANPLLVESWGPAPGSERRRTPQPLSAPNGRGTLERFPWEVS